MPKSWAIAEAKEELLKKNINIIPNAIIIYLS